MKIPTILQQQAFLAGVLSVVLNGCAVKEADITPEGLLSVLGPSPDFSLENLPKDWIIEKEGSLNKNQLQIVTKNDKFALKITNAKNTFTIARRINAMMLATPFLSWSWFVEQSSIQGYHPLSIVVGFRGGDSRSHNQSSRSFNWFGNTLPEHDRAIKLTWGESALQRGTLNPPQNRTKLSQSYTVRGGRENTGLWWLETIDVSTLYSKIWPEDNIASIRIVFIGVSAVAERLPAPIQFSSIKLSR